MGKIAYRAIIMKSKATKMGKRDNGILIRPSIVLPIEQYPLRRSPNQTYLLRFTKGVREMESAYV